MDPDAAGPLVLSLCSATAIVASFTALFWAAVQDGRDARRHRQRG